MNGQKQRIGFAAMDPDKQKAIASQGGKSAHKRGKAHKWTSEEARAAGKKGSAVRVERLRVNEE